MADKVFINAFIKKVEFNNGGSVINCAINVKDLSQYADEKGYARVVIKTKKETDKYWCTHYMELDTRQHNNTKTEDKPTPWSLADIASDDNELPF